MSELIKIDLPDEVIELLKPIEGESPVGIDANSVDEYFKLNMEIGKISPDYKLCVELAITILEEKSKDMWVASWLCFSWFRTDGLIGFRNGLILLLNLLRNFGEDIFPNKINHRSKAIQYLNSNRFFKLLEKEKVSTTNAQPILEARDIFNSLVKECGKQFHENPPLLKSVEQAIETLCEDTEKFVKKDSVGKGSTDLEKEKFRKNMVEETEPKPEGKKESEEVVEELTVHSIPQVETRSTKEIKYPTPTNDKEALSSIRKNLRFFFEDDLDNKKLKVPSEAFIYSLTRSLVWGKFSLPPSKGNITQIEPPNSVIQNKIHEWYSSNDWNVLIPRIELNFLNPDSGFQYWLDSQRYVITALENKGGPYLKVVEEIKISLALLLNRFPQMTDLKFKNRETAFANKDTLNWINNDIRTFFDSSKINENPMVLPPIMGEDYNSINEEYLRACNELPENFGENMAKMQQQISGDARRKGQFLRQLNLANLCIEAKQFKLAKVHLLQLIEKIEEFNLAEWEPALCVAVWQSTYLVNFKLLKMKDKVGKNIINSEQEELFAKIAKYDGVLAIKLSNIN